MIACSIRECAPIELLMFMPGMSLVRFPSSFPWSSLLPLLADADMSVFILSRLGRCA